MTFRRFGLLPCSLALGITVLAVARGAWGQDEARTAVTVQEPQEASQAQELTDRFGFDSVIQRAEALAADAYRADRPPLPDYFVNLSYDQYRDIRFRRDRALWRSEGLPFWVEPLPRGSVYKDRVTLNLIENGQSVPLPFNSSLFDFGKNETPSEVPGDLGFAGFRLLHLRNPPDPGANELAVFLGASYFRALGQGLVYGISARGLAIDTGLASKEEFPVFREFWIEKPTPDATAVVLYGLLDSPSVAGAFRFEIVPGVETVMQVQARLFVRERIRKLGLAPLTSMFFQGEDTDRFTDDLRPEVHDSDGLLVVNGTGERIWRPLVNPEGLRISGFGAENPSAFGLLQRDRDFRNYQDLEAQYQARPSALVEPVGEWGRGRVELVEIPSDSDRYDNIVAFWVADQPATAGQQLQYAYRLRFAADPEAGSAGGRVMSTRIGAGGTGSLNPMIRKFVLDFSGENLAGLPADAPSAAVPLEAVVMASTGQLSKPVVQHNPHVQGWRLLFELNPEGDGPVDMRAFLRKGDDFMSETWSFQWIRD